MCEDVENERLHYPNLQIIFDDNEGIGGSQSLYFMQKHESGFEERFTDFKKILKCRANFEQLFSFKSQRRFKQGFCTSTTNRDRREDETGEKSEIHSEFF